MNIQKLVQEEVENDMTPMIDCVFLLMIFFVLVIDLSQKNLEDLILPQAEFQEPDDSPPENRPILNVLQNGAVSWGGVFYFDPTSSDPTLRDPANIKSMLRDVRRKVLAADPTKLVDKDVGGTTAKVLDEPILIRADKWTEWHYVGEIMKQCSQPDIAFWKVQLALSEEDKEAKMLQSLTGGK